MATRSLVVLPDDSAQPILDAISAAAKSIRVKMFVFSDPALTRAVIAARPRGVKDTCGFGSERWTPANARTSAAVHVIASTVRSM